MDRKLNILFLCTGNSCRSQMAEGFANSIKGDSMVAFSAGVEAKGVDPLAIKVMNEAGVDISHHNSKNVKDMMDKQFDFVITVCGHAHETCPVFPGQTKVIHHGFEDPPALVKDLTDEEEILSIYRRVRDEIKAYIETLPEALEKDNSSIPGVFLQT